MLFKKNQQANPDPLWILIANRAKARIYSMESSYSGLRWISGMLCNEARRNKPEPKQSSSSHFTTISYPGSHEHVTELFAKEIASTLRTSRAKNLFKDLVLISEPSFLGRLNVTLDKATKKRVVSAYSGDIANASQQDIIRVVRGLIKPSEWIRLSA